MAIKILEDKAYSNEQFIKEIWLISSIDHPNVLKVLAFNNDGEKISKIDGNTKPVTYSIMELA